MSYVNVDLTLRYCECLIAGSGRRSGGSDTAPDDSWIVRGHVSGGPEDGSVIPSFLGHVAVSIWGRRQEEDEYMHGQKYHNSFEEVV